MTDFSHPGGFVAAALSMALIFGLATIAACSTQPTAPDDPQADLEEIPQPVEPPAEFRGLVHDAEIAYGRRDDADQLGRAIELWSDALEIRWDRPDSPARAEVHESLAKAHHYLARYELSDGPVPADSDDVAGAVDTGLTHARKAIAIRAPAVDDAIEHGAPFEADLPVLSDETLESLMWYAKHLHLRAQISDVERQAADLPVADELMERVLERAPKMHHGAAPRYFGIRHIDRPMRRAPAASWRAFEESLEVDPNFLPTRVFRVRFLATFEGEREEFESELQAVVESRGAPNGAAPENDVARNWAADLLERTDEWFE